MESFNLTRVRELLPKQLPRMPTWPAAQDTDATSDSADAKENEGSSNVIALPEPSPKDGGPKSNLDLIGECDSFPYYHTNPKLFLAHINTYYALKVPEYPDADLGYLLPSVAEAFRGLPDWRVDDEERSLTLTSGSTEEERSRIVAATAEAMRATDHFKILRGWRDELYAVYGPKRELLFSIERAASALFGIVTYGCHMMAYTKKDGELKLWVPRRAATKQTYGGMLDNTVAGGIATGESPFECIVREAGEEASLPEDLVRKDAKAVGTVTYFHIRDHRAGGETRLLQPEVQYVYDIELPEDVEPKPSDDEVEAFELMTIDETKVALRNGEFKPNCAVVLLDFFVRHGILTSDDEGYIEIVARLHRRLEFPTL
ncbi:hypothetical protein WHR41_03823 [Cladosporium halotolerans]|uniref:Nudix hydrolase domain-containing protein n=1 Tax=Cladosporium halotolerans TaxID=1052096 RepID=A0AB34KVV6_9PEZI